MQDLTKKENSFSVLINNDIQGTFIVNVSYEEIGSSDIENIKDELNFLNKLIGQESVSYFGDHGKPFKGMVMEALVESNLHIKSAIDYEDNEESPSFEGRIYALKGHQDYGVQMSVIERSDKGYYENYSFDEFIERHKLEIFINKMIKMDEDIINKNKLSFNGELGYELSLDSGDSFDPGLIIKKADYNKLLNDTLTKAIAEDLDSIDDQEFVKDLGNGIKLQLWMNEDNSIHFDYSSIEIKGTLYSLSDEGDSASIEDECYINSEIIDGLKKIKQDLSLKSKKKRKLKQS